MYNKCYMLRILFIRLLLIRSFYAHDCRRPDLAKYGHREDFISESFNSSIIYIESDRHGEKCVLSLVLYTISVNITLGPFLFNWRDVPLIFSTQSCLQNIPINSKEAKGSFQTSKNLIPSKKPEMKDTKCTSERNSETKQTSRDHVSSFRSNSFPRKSRWKLKFTLITLRKNKATFRQL